MNKKLIVLMLLLPLLLMLSIFTSTKTVSLNVQVAVNKIEISGENLVYLDLEKDEKYFVSYAIYPVAATNKKVLFTTEAVNGEQLAELEFKDGYIIPKSVGLAKVYLTTVDGGYKDSFIVKVESKSLISIDSQIANDSILVGETIAIDTTFNPSNYGNQILNYQSSDSSIVSVNQKGVIRGEGRGVATITITSDANKSVKDEIVVNVYNKDVIDLSQEEIYSSATSGYINLSISATQNYSLTYKVYDTNNNVVEDVIDIDNTSFVDMGEGRKKFEYSLRDTFVGTVVIRFTIDIDGVIVEKECIINKVNRVEAAFDKTGDLFTTVGSPLLLLNEITLVPEDADVEYNVSLSNSNLSVNKTTLVGKNPGVTKVTLKITNSVSGEELTLEKDVVIVPDDIFINEQEFESFGIENIWTIGKKESNGSENISKITSVVGPVSAGDNFYSNYHYYTDTEKVIVENDGTVKILDDNFSGLVKVTGRFEYKGVTYNQTENPFTIRCLGKGVNVRNFADLYNVTNSNKVVVLQGDIIDDFGKIDGNNIYNENTVTKIQSTYDITHYKNINKLDSAKVKVLINFRADVYGNGYVINAHNVAYGLDSADELKKDAFFQGPLNFAATSESESSMVSVKGQDNISFAVYENVTINNIDLRSCELKSDENGYDLTDLTYVGTTVEVMGDNVNINYCRLSNGRTVLRCFGDINDSNKVININIKNSVLSNAREFLIRMSSNAFVDGTKNNPSPFIDSNEEITFPVQKDYTNNMSDSERSTYDSKYIKTFINLKNSILKDSGLFCIGIDAHFSGIALADGTGFADGVISSWKDMAKTSYGAKLTLEGDVRMYGWKKLSTIDSSSLIEIFPKASEGNAIVSKYQSLNFDIQELINGIAEKKYPSIVSEYKGEKYVHGGIAFFGGGKNYSVVDQSNNTFPSLTGYAIKLSEVGKTELQAAAGSESFYFLINDDNSAMFKPDDQENILNGNSAYAPIYNKD